MKRLTVAALLSLSLAAQAAPVESKASIDSGLRPREVQALVTLVVASGYRCDSVSAALPFIMSPGFTLSCNNTRYTYEVRDEGGRYRVKIK